MLNEFGKLLRRNINYNVTILGPVVYSFWGLWCIGLGVWLWIRCNLLLRFKSTYCHRLYLDGSYLPCHEQCFHSATFICMYVHGSNSYHLYSDVILLNCDIFRRWIKPNYYYYWSNVQLFLYIMPCAASCLWHMFIMSFPYLVTYSSESVWLIGYIMDVRISILLMVCCFPRTSILQNLLRVFLLLYLIIKYGQTMQVKWIMEN